MIHLTLIAYFGFVGYIGNGLPVMNEGDFTPSQVEAIIGANISRFGRRNVRIIGRKFVFWDDSGAQRYNVVITLS